MIRLVYLCSLAIAIPLTFSTGGCNKQGKVPDAPKPRRPKEVKVDEPDKVTQTDSPITDTSSLPSSVPYAQRSIPESKNLALSGARMLRTAHSPKTPEEDKEDLVIDAVKQLITALRADPYNVHATYNLASAYALVKRNQCAINLLNRLVLLRKLDSQKVAVEKKVDRLLGRGRFAGRLDPDFRRLRDVETFRELVKKLDPTGT